MKSARNSEVGSDRKQGTSMVLVLLIVTVLGGLAAGMLSVAGRRASWQRQDQESQNALMVAEAGVDQAIALGNDGQFNGLAQGTSTTLAQSTLSGGTLDVDVFRLADAVDVVNGVTITTRTLRVESTGAYGGSSRIVVGFLRQVEQQGAPLGDLIPVVESAVMLSDPFAQIKFNGTSFLISGDDKNLNGTAGPNAPVWGLGAGPQADGTEGDVEGLKSQINANQEGLVVGQGASPSVGAVGAVQVETIIQTLAPYADIVFDNYAGTYTGDLGNYPANDPQLVYSSGDLKISGGNPGYGILLIDGNLTISGNWDYTGLVFVNGQVTFTGGGNTKKLTGSVFLTGDMRDLEISGNITVQYSSEAIGLVTTWLNGITPPNTTEPYAFVSSAETLYN